MPLYRSLARCACLLLILLTATPGAHAQGAEATQAFEREFGDAYLDRYWQLNGDAAIAVGYYRYADTLRAPDAKLRSAQLAFIQLSLQRLATYDRTVLDAAARSDAALLKNQLESQRWALTEYRDWQWNPAQYNVADSFALLLDTGYAPLEQRLRTVSKRLTQVPAYYAAAQRQVQHPVREYTQLAIEQNRGALGVFGDELQKRVNDSALKPAERSLLLRRAAAARSAIEGYIAFLQKIDAAQGAETRSFRIGAALYERKFAYDIQSGDSAEALYRRALAEKDRLHAQMEQLTTQLWPKYMGDTPPPADRLDRIGALIQRIAQNHVRPEHFVDTVKAQIPQLEKWVSDHQLLTLDPTRPLQVRETPPYQRGFSVASLAAPGPYDPTANTYYNVSPLDGYTPEQAESFLREYNDYIVQVLNIHEAVPGHYVQLLYSNKSPSRIKALFGNGAMVEGWAVYAERMMLESGWAESPEMWLMYSKWNLRVVCNTILDYSLHVLNLSEADAMRLLTHEAFQSQTEASGKWRRARLSSVQLTSYFAGYSAIYDLRERLKREQGKDFDLKRFHEQFLSYGSAPVSMIESLMRGN